MDQLISVILPVYNQADHIEKIVQEYEKELQRLPCAHELILVVNGCRDNSLAVCQSLAGRYATVRVVHSAKGGWGLAIKRGLEAAHGTSLCYTNSARTSPADLLLLLLYAVAHPETVVKANRKIREGVGRRIGSLLFNLECRTLFDLSNWDVNGTPKVFPRVFADLLRLSRDDDVFDAEFNAICRRQGYPIIEVPIFSSRRHGGKSTTTLRSAVKLYWGAYKLWRSMRKAG
jgi:glycosyltransferase involved in cell wall biosynthesis